MDPQTALNAHSIIALITCIAAFFCGMQISQGILAIKKYLPYWHTERKVVVLTCIAVGLGSSVWLFIMYLMLYYISMQNTGLTILNFLVGAFLHLLYHRKQLIPKKEDDNA